MAHIGYSAEISKIVKEIPYEALIRTEDIAQRLAEQLDMPYDKAKVATNVKLKRMADQGKLKRIQKGIYCHLEQTVFGPIAPDIDEIIIRSVTMKDDARIGYESGPSLLNRLGLSTLLPRRIEITTNRYNTSLPEKCCVKLAKPTTMITNENWEYLQFLDVIEFLPNAHIDTEKPGMLLGAFMKERGLDPLALIFTERKHYLSKTVLRLTNLLMEVRDDPAS